MVRIRSAHSNEADLLAEIGIRAWEQAMMTVGDARSMVESARRAFRNFTRSSLMTILVAEQSGQPVGWAARENLDDKITDFWIDPGHQGRGYSKVLLAAVEGDVINRGFEQVHLETHAINKQALSFFRQQGYGVNWLSVVYNPKLDRDIEMVGMVKRLIGHQAITYGPAGFLE